MQFLIHEPPWGLLASATASSVIALIAVRWLLRGQGGGPGVVVLSIAVYSLHALLYIGFTVDDAFITFRYAHHWAIGMGPIYQSGERVEGFTSFWWTGLLALAERLGIRPEIASKIASYLAGVLSLVLSSRLSRLLLRNHAVADLCPLIIALQPLYAAWTFAGMEAVLFSAALVASVASLVEDLDAARPPLLSAGLFGILAWIRPEGMLFAGCAFASLYGPLSGRAQSLRIAWTWLALFAAIVVPFWLWRWNFFGAFFPNTFYAKTPLSLGHLYQGARTLIDFATYGGLLALLMLLLSALRADWQSPLWRYLMLSLSLFALYVIWAGGDILHLRFFVHVLPLVVLASMPGLECAIGALRRSLGETGARAGSIAVAGSVLAWTLLSYSQDARALATADQFGPAYVVGNARNVRSAIVPLASWLREHADADSRVAAWDIGALGYYSELRIVDLWGLTNRTYAKLYHRRARALELLDSLRVSPPEFIVDYATCGRSVPSWLEADPEWIHRHYVARSSWASKSSPYTLELFERTDPPVPSAR